MGISKEDFRNLAATLQQQRDELKVKLHLAEADARDEWTKLEKTWEKINMKMDTVREEAGKTAGAVSTALEMALDEIKKGYERIRKTL